VHLDHAGGCGTLMRELPAATLVVHPRGARHLIDPTALWAGATAVYGAQEMQRAYGEVLPVPAGRVRTTEDGMRLALAGRELLFIDTPGHARHHHCIWDAATRGWFTGDTFGLSYPELDSARGAWMLPTSTPVQFEPDVLRRSIDRLLTFEPACMYITHYGRVERVAQCGAQLIEVLDALVALGRSVQHASDRHERLKAGQMTLFTTRLAAHGCTLSPAQIADLLAVDLQLNAQGMAVWLDRP
jgi:glyoxylase-like metal-dependent hydrolase (beta-lactamase superfamily II)